MSFQRYPAYKVSGVEWLGEVPEHWDVVQFKKFVDIENGSDHKHVERSEGYPVLGSGGVFAYASEFLYDGESVLLGRKGTIDKPLHITGRFWTVDTMYWTKISLDVSGRFTYYSALAIPFDFYSTNTGLPSMTKGVLSSHRVACPPLPEQTQIATFLDHETAKIDGLIAEQQRLIELLQEKRQAVISHAVTKGLNPEASKKDSGVEWLGEVPVHWGCGKIKHYFKTASGSTPNTESQELYYSSQEDGIPWIRTTDIADSDVTSAEVFITEKALADTACDLLPVGTVLVALYGGAGTVGKNGILRITSTINQALCGLLPSKYCLPEYCFRYIQFLRPFWMERAVSARKAGNISQELVRDTTFTLPPIKEQEEIVAFLDAKLADYDVLQAQCQLAIEALQERRSALISAAVTGQIDVRGLVPLEAAT